MKHTSAPFLEMSSKKFALKKAPQRKVQARLIWISAVVVLRWAFGSICQGTNLAVFSQKA